MYFMYSSLLYLWFLPAFMVFKFFAYVGILLLLFCSILVFPLSLCLSLHPLFVFGCFYSLKFERFFFSTTSLQVFSPCSFGFSSSLISFIYLYISFFSPVFFLSLSLSLSLSVFPYFKTWMFSTKLKIASGNFLARRVEKFFVVVVCCCFCGFFET